LESAWSKFKKSREFLALPAAEIRKISTWMQDSLAIARDEVASLMRLRLGRDSLQSESGRSIVSILSTLSDQEVFRVYARTRGLDAGEALTDLEQAIASKISSFERRLDGPIRTSKSSVNTSRRLEVLNPMLSAAPPGIAGALRIAEEAMREGASMRAWAEDLYAECLEAAMNASDPSILEGILESRSIPESIYSEVLRQRGIRNGFSPNGVTLDRQVDQEEFMSYMRDRRLIVDETFRRDKHGVFAHIAQMDYLQYALTQRGSPVKAVDVYVYLGSNKAIHEAGWERLFDGFAGDVYEPETFYPILEELFPRKPSATGWSK
jgi:hypothetical protein